MYKYSSNSKEKVSGTIQLFLFLNLLFDKDKNLKSKWWYTVTAQYPRCEYYTAVTNNTFDKVICAWTNNPQ